MSDVKTTFKGYPADVLDRVFEAVGNPEDPCAPFVALVPENMVDVVCAAIEWFTAVAPVVIPKEDDHYMVISEGYCEGGLLIVSKEGKNKIDDES
jgi:hypothetical protein